ncbi:MAG: hypothetical protein GKS03_01775 [Alphaproteobacteria bacterium]|nr:hypothetical protein [Alphaproteobacteria bacterium]
MAFSFNEDKPTSPAIARILNFMGWTSIIGCACGVMLAFSGYPWVNDVYAMAGSGIAIILGILFIGQAKTLEALTILNARMKSRFALEGLTGSAALGEATNSPPIIPQRKERVVKISAEDARRSGVTPR